LTRQLAIRLPRPRRQPPAVRTAAWTDPVARALKASTLSRAPEFNGCPGDPAPPKLRPTRRPPRHPASGNWCGFWYL